MLCLQMMEKARQQISIEEDSVMGATALSNVLEEYPEAERLYNDRPMNYEGRTLSIF